MDPDEALDNLRALIREGSDVDAIAEQFAALDEWLGGGGFLPADWHQPST